MNISVCNYFHVKIVFDFLDYFYRSKNPVNFPFAAPRIYLTKCYWDQKINFLTNKQNKDNT